MVLNLFYLLASKPKAETAQFERKTKEKEPNRGFKTAIDGRLIIAEPKRGGGDDSSDSDSDEPSAVGGQKRAHSDSSDDDNEDAAANEAVSRKRKAIDSHSMASGRSSSKYQTGGKGIHRPTGGASSVRSGASRMSMATTKSASTAFGGEAFRGKKGKGDIKKKGKLDPYAYIPLSRTSMNKR